MKTFKLLIARHSLDGFRRPRVGLDILSKMFACLLTLLSFGLPYAFESAFDSDAVETVEVDSDEATAIRCRNASRRRVFSQEALTIVRRVVANRPSGRLANLSDVVVPHDFDLRNGLGANLLC